MCVLIPFFWCTVQTPLFPSVFALKHASSDLKPFAVPLHMFSAGSGSQTISPFQTEGKGYKFSHSFRNTKYTVQESQIHLQKNSSAIVKMLLKVPRKYLLLKAGKTVLFSSCYIGEYFSLLKCKYYIPL